MRLRSILTRMALYLFVGIPFATALGQAPSRQEIEKLLSDPAAGEALRHRIQQPRLTPDQIRSCLGRSRIPLKSSRPASSRRGSVL